MNAKRMLWMAALILIVGGVAISLSISRQRTAEAAERQAAYNAALALARSEELSRTTPPSTLAPLRVADQKPQSVVPTPKPVEPPKPAEQELFLPQPVPDEIAQPVPPQPEPFTPTYEVAREALGLLGIDPDADDYWIASINDPRMSPKQRQDLIEDLNEDGLSDPKNPTRADLPVIIYRLQLIEDLAPNAVDDVNYAAFEEAYKDLLNMFKQLARR